MDDFSGRTAVVTGAASGIGLALARRFGQAGMRVVLADVDAHALEGAEAAVKATGAATLAVRVDVMDPADVERLAAAAFATFGDVHVLCNNAGVSGASPGLPPWETPLADWAWVLGVNLNGVLHGIRAFVPRMIGRGDEGHIVNTASIGGLFAGSSLPYTVSKHGVVALTEILYRELKARGTRLSASVLCPGRVATNIMDSARYRRSEVDAQPENVDAPTPAPALRDAARAALADGDRPETIADYVFEGIQRDQFYLFPVQPELLALVDQRLDEIARRANPGTPRRT